MNSALNTKKKILIINCYFSEFRLPVKLKHEVPDTLVPIFLAGAFKDEYFEIRLYNEVCQGFIEMYDPKLLGWPDMIVMTSLTMSFDRLLHVTAYAKSRNKDVITVAGGHAIRSFPRYSRNFFDYVCYGDVEEICNVIEDVYGSHCVNKAMPPRYDLAFWNRWLFGYGETSRYCIHRCDFCSLSAEGHRYKDLGVDALREQVYAMGKKLFILFLDNQFYGPDREFFRQKLLVLKKLRKEKQFHYWSAICSNTFLWDVENIQLAKEAGCISLFIGVESFDEAWLSKINKRVNNHNAQRELIELCNKSGILFQYGIVIDPSQRRIADIYRELDYISENSEIPSPQYIFSAIPLPGTKLLRERAKDNLILPNTKVRDLEGSTLTLKTLDSEEKVGTFLKNFRCGYGGYLKKMMIHHARFLWYYRKNFNTLQFLGSAGSFINLFWPSTFANLGNIFVKDKKQAPRTHISTTDPLDCVYEPKIWVDSKYESYFKPTWVTDFDCNFNENLVEDLFDDRAAKKNKKTLSLKTAPSARISNHQV